jgi:hypothetical protein
MSLASGLLDNGFSLATLQRLADAREKSKLEWDWIFLLGPREREGGPKRPKADERYIYFAHDAEALEVVRRAMPLRADEVWPLEPDEDLENRRRLWAEEGEEELATPDGATVIAAENPIPVRKLVGLLDALEAKGHGRALTILHKVFAHHAAEYVTRLRVLAFEEVPAGARSSRGPSDALLLFRNPRGIWQLSSFSEKYGPTGHQEGETPLELLERMSTDARPDDGSALRHIMASVDESHEFWRRG